MPRTHRVSKADHTCQDEYKLGPTGHAFGCLAQCLRGARKNDLLDVDGKLYRIFDIEVTLNELGTSNFVVVVAVTDM